MRRMICSGPWPARLILAVCGALLIAGSLAWTHADAEERKGQSAASLALIDPQLASVDLERIFWQCDYVANTFGVGLEEGAYCSAIYDEVKKRKFAGDFAAMLAWWQQNKTVEYAALAARGRRVDLR
ncbi:MAG TPA: hypothetical protein VMM27_13900 [Casimicrobiaceae bacterium]|nr:hypothetical protein [Casimicrobiaceae bacterium]